MSGDYQRFLAVLVVATAAMIAVSGPPWWWCVALTAALASQVAIATSWDDAKAGTLVNLVLLLVATYDFLSAGRFRFSAQGKTRANAPLGRPSHV